MNPRLALTDDELATVRAILRAHLPADVTAHAFGSRTTGTSKPWSDLDLVLEGPDALPLALLGRLTEAFEDSALTWKVDLVDRRTIGAGFGAIVDAAKVALS